MSNVVRMVADPIGSVVNQFSGGLFGGNSTVYDNVGRLTGGGVKGGPQQPPAPDFTGAANAQGQANIEAARLTGRMANPNVNGPFGSQTVTWNGDQATVNQRLDPSQQALLNANTGIQTGLANSAGSQLGRVNDAMGRAFDMSGVPGRVSGVGDQGIQRNMWLNNNFAGDISQGQGVQGQINTAGMPAPNFDFARRGVQSGVDLNTGGRYDYNRSAMPGQVDLNVGGRYDFNRGQVPQNVDLNTGGVGDFARRGVQQGVDISNLNSAGDYARGGVQGNVDLNLGAQGDFARGGVQNNVAGAGDAARNAAEQALYSRSTARLDPRFSTQEDNLKSNLVAQGLHPGTEAYERALRDFNFQKNDAYSSAMNDAIAAGGAEQQRQFGMNLSSGQFSNQAQQQAAGQNLQASQLYNQAANDVASRRLSMGNFANSAQGQAAGQNLQAAQLQNQASNDIAGRRLQAGQFANQAQGQEAAQNLQGANLYNDLATQMAQRRLQMGQFAQQGQAQEAGQNLQSAGLYNQAAQNEAQNRLAAGNFGLARQGQEANQNLQSSQLYNQAADQEAQRRLSAGNFANTAQGQEAGQNLAGANLGNTAQAQMFGQRQAQGNFANTAQAQDFSQRAQNVGMINTALAARNQTALQGGQFNNQAAELGFNQDLQRANLANAQRGSAIQEQAYLRQLPLQELNALRTGTQPTMPNFQNFQGPAVAPAPVFAGAQAQNGFNMDLYNSQVGQQNAMMGAMGQMGAAAIPFLFSDMRLKKNIARVGQLPSGLPLYEFEYIWGGGRQTGVMAQETQEYFPEAVLTLPNGYMMVNYARIS